MPILDIGYRSWQGERRPAWTRAWVVASTGVSLVWRGAWFRRLLILLTFPSLIAAILVGTFEQTLSNSSTRDAWRFLDEFPRARQAALNAGLDMAEVRSDPQIARHFVWTYVLFSLFRYPQAFGMILLVGLVAPRLISYDIRSRGYLLYLSRPLTPAEYVLGKAGILYVIVFLVATLPALAIYLMGLFLSTNSWALFETWDIPLRILGASLVLILPTSAIALALSALVAESRYAGFIWFALWLLGQVVFQAFWVSERLPQWAAGTRVVDEAYSRFIYFSPYELLGYMQKMVFGLLPGDAPLWLPLLAIVAITLVGYWTAYWRVSRMLKS
ncbi:MAG: ABC transporter permease subunit [Pirellulaceae bacterium]|nr:ABC transporter permease subunit [Pirellulaceae bacterium]